MSDVSKLSIDTDYIEKTLLKLLAVPSPTGFTDEIVHTVGKELSALNIPFEVTRRGAIRATIEGQAHSPDRAIVCHLDTLGAMVCKLKDNGRLGITRIGHWSARFAEGARVTIYTDTRSFRGTILPLKASGHAYNNEVDTQPVSWDNLEIRVDEQLYSKEDLVKAGFNIGDFIAIDTNTEVLESGFINSRFLDNRGGTTVLLAACKAVLDAGYALPVDCHPLFTISEEEGTGASSILHGDVASMVVVDNSIVAPPQNSTEEAITIVMRDSSGIFDYHLTHKLIRLCKENNIEHYRDVYHYARTDAASAIDAGNDLRTALVGFGVDASHGYERTHMKSMVALTKLLCSYMISEPEIKRDKQELGSISGFTHQITEENS